MRVRKKKTDIPQNVLNYFGQRTLDRAVIFLNIVDNVDLHILVLVSTVSL